MPILTVRGRASIMLVVSSGLPLIAQSSNYHMELVDVGPGITNTVLVNDSSQPIEAFHVLEKCDAGDGWWDRDVLSGPGAPGGTSSDIHGAHGRFSRTIGVEPGGRWDGQHLGKDKGRECQERADAVIFADGSYEGDEASVRSLMAQRDGVAAELKYWAEKFKGENPDGSTLSSILAEARRRKKEDDAWLNSYRLYVNTEPEPLLREYWLGRWLVDQNLLVHLPEELPADKASAIFIHAAGFIGDWKEKFDNDVSMKKLSLIFQPISVTSGDSAETAAQP